MEHWWYDEPRRALDRLTHLVLVDGRLVDTWSEPVWGTRWEEHARRFDRERRPALPAPPPPRPAHEEALEWLSAICGGPAAVAALHGQPLDDGPDLPEVEHRPHRERLEAAAELLDGVAARLFHAEGAAALRRGLLGVWDVEPEVLTGSVSAAYAAGGVCWAVGKANGWFGGRTGLTQTTLRDSLGVTKPLSGPGQRVEVALRGLLVDRQAMTCRPLTWGVPDLLPLGRTDVLVSSTRSLLVRLRDRAEEARAALAA